MRNILAIDPATVSGFAHSNGERGVWRIGTMDGFRQLNLLREILDAAKAWGCDLIAYEEASFGSINPNVQAFHNELRGIIKLAAAELKVVTVSYHPTSIKAFATGSGRAKKPQMIAACKRVLGITPADDNEADALWILAMAQAGYKPKTGKKARTRPVKAGGEKQQTLFGRGKVRQVRKAW